MLTKVPNDNRTGQGPASQCPDKYHDLVRWHGEFQ